MTSIDLAFDLYGTLLDTSSVSKQLSLYLPSINAAETSTIAAEWRKYLLEYTWRLNSMGVYENFDVISRKSLVHAVKEAGYELSEEGIEAVIGSYEVFEDVPQLLKKLRAMPNITTLIFSNGTEKTVSGLIKSRKELQHFTSLHLPFVVVEEVKKYKPATSVYHHLAKRVGKEHQLDRVWLISGNPFDIVGARQAGLNAIWLDRKRRGWVDQLGEPSMIVHDLEDVVDIVSAL